MRVAILPGLLRRGVLSAALSCVTTGVFLTGAVGVARADRTDDLTKSLLHDGSYKVRVQAALVLGKLKDRRAVDALAHALLHDDNSTVRGTAAASLGQIGDQEAKGALEAAKSDADSFVRGQVERAIAMLGGGGPGPGPQPSSGARFYLAVGFKSPGKGSAADVSMLRQVLAKELQKLPQVAVSSGGVEPTAAALNQRKLQGFIVDGTIQRLTAQLGGGGTQIDCDLKAQVMTFPGNSLKMMTTAGASLQAGASEGESAKRDCIQAAAEAIRDDVGKYLKTVQ